MKPPPFDYVAPSRLEVATELLASETGATVLAGGQSLLPLLNMRLSAPRVILDIKHVNPSAGIERRSNSVRIGMCVTQARALKEALSGGWCPMLPEALAHVGNRETRNRGTVVGSIAHSDPVAELPAVMVALGAKYELTSTDGVRVVKAEEFHLGPYLTARSDAELITAVEISDLPRGGRWGFSELRDGVFARCGIAAVCGPARSGLEGLKLVAFGIGNRPLRLEEVEEAAQRSPNSSREAVLSWAQEHDEVRDGSLAQAVATLVERQLLQFLDRGK